DIGTFFSTLKNTHGDDFTIDYNNIKARTFLISEYHALSNYISSNTDDFGALKIYYLLNDNINYLNSHIWATDFERMNFKYRLDIGEEDNYSCNARSNVGDIQIRDVSLDNVDVRSQTFGTFLAKGSHKVVVSYSVSQILSSNQKF